ncbi:SDR family oxidoreductase [Pyruvatibacter sp.]|uniref:SDR family NAD(P)-dependent oxidoreductase n=1 Tax=Pyruvatibacter sp. TaxID=1981328 RepID=UPI0032647D7A
MATAPKRKATAKKSTRKSAAKRKTASRSKASGRPANKGSQGQWVLITGASAGIGEALAGKFAAGGFDLVLAARSKDKLAKLGKKLSAEHGIATEVAQIDLSKPGAPRDLFNEMASRGIDIDVLVNNAGVLEMGPFKSQEPETLGDMIRLNTVALTELAALFVPPMAKRKSGRVLNVASVASFQPVPSLAVYAGTKAFVLSLTESLAEELKSDGVTVTALCPGITQTNMFGTIKSSNERTERIPSFLVGDVQEVAQEGYDACIKGDVVRVPGLAYAMTTSIGRASPRWLTRLVAGAIGRQMM